MVQLAIRESLLSSVMTSNINAEGQLAGILFIFIIPLTKNRYSFGASYYDCKKEVHNNFCNHLLLNT